MKRILTILIATLVSIFVFFHFGLLDGWVQSVTAILIVFVISFLFTTVAANAIAIVGTNPVSGMTLMTLILSSLVLVSVGLSGTTGMTAALIIGGVVCTALSMAGGFITDLKIGYWLGTTPRKQEAWKFLGTFVAAATVAGVMIILNKSYGFVGEGALVAPQANAMAAVIQPLMTGGQTPWMLYFCGAALALVLTSIGVPALAFALGMFIPMELNAPLVVGGLVAWFVSNRSKDEAAQQGALRPRHADRVGLHRRRRADGRSERPPEIRRGGLVPKRMGLVERRRVDRTGHVPRTDRLLRLAHAESKGRGINTNKITRTRTYSIL